MITLTDAIVFVMSQHVLTDVERCIAYSLARGYNVIGVVRDNWQQAIDYLHDGTATVMVVAARNKLDPCREPRIEAAAEGGGPGPEGQARPRIIG